VRRVARFSTLMLVATAWVLASSVLPAKANTVVYDYCAVRCYAQITQGVDLSTNSWTLTNLSSATETAYAFCQQPANTSDFAMDDTWLVTPPNPNAPAYQSALWSPEWIETGIRTGQLAGQYRSISFFWAREYFNSSPYNRYLYNEYLLSGTPSLSQGYVLNTSYSTSDHYWHIHRDGASFGSIQTQQPPGSHQALEAGAEQVTSQDSDGGEVYSLQDIQGGVTHNSWTGYVYYDPTVFYYVGQDSTYLLFASNSC
jgi:hypothetical protein